MSEFRRRLMMAAAQGGLPIIEPVLYDYLVFDGSSYIDTYLTMGSSNSYAFICGNETLKAAQRIFMFSTADSKNTGVIFTSSTSSSNRSIGFYYGSGNLSSIILSFSSITEYKVMLTPNRLQANTNIQTHTKNTKTSTTALTIGSTSAHSGNPYSGRMKTFYIYDSTAQNATSYDDLVANYTPIYTLQPCTYNGEAGLWCSELNKFYGNTSPTGTLSVI